MGAGGICPLYVEFLFERSVTRVVVHAPEEQKGKDFVGQTITTFDHECTYCAHRMIRPLDAYTRLGLIRLPLMEVPDDLVKRISQVIR